MPGYRVSPRYLQNVNSSNTRGLNAADVSNVARNPTLPYRYANRDIPRALTVVPQVNFSAGQPVARHAMTLPPQWAAATLSARTPGIIPGRESVLGPVALGHVSRPPAAILDRPVMTHRQPPPAAPRFELQQSAIQANGGRPLDSGQLLHLRAPESARRSSVNTPAVRPAAAGSEYRHIPERPPQFQSSPPATDSNVFRKRDRELQQQREQEQQQLQQQRQRLQHQEPPPSAAQQRPVELARPVPRVVTPPLEPQPQPQQQPQPPPQPKTQIRRLPQLPSEQR